MRTLFNMLGPMTNPAGVKHQVIGVFTDKLCRPMAEVLRQLGSTHVMVVHAKDGLDEFSLASSTHVAELKDGEILEYSLTPEAVGLQSQSLVGLDIDGAAASLALIQDALGEQSTDITRKAADMIALNAGAAIYAADLEPDFAAGVARAKRVIEDGSALAKMKQLAEFSSQLG